MTGEATLRGRVLPVGGIKMKLLAAHRAGLKTVLLPKRNEKDLEELPDEVRKAIRFVFVERIDDALRAAFLTQIFKVLSTKFKLFRISVVYYNNHS
jgi:ATP-dependent Lon protease